MQRTVPGLTLLLTTLVGPLADAARPDGVRALRDELRGAETAHDAPIPAPHEPVALDPAWRSRLDEGAPGYVALALHQSPDVRAAFERWEASVHRVARPATLPEPTLSAGIFALPVETRVGPQRARFSLQQAFPWPTALLRGQDAASAEARAVRARFDATVLSVARRVRDAYWTLWEIRRTRALHAQHLDVLEGLSATLRARLEVGRATLADLQQVDLSRARLADGIASMDEQALAAQAWLRAAVGLRDAAPLPTLGPATALGVPAEAAQALVDAALGHPELAALDHRIQAAEQARRAAGAKRLPTTTIGLDWILTDEARTAGVDRSGQDAVAIGIGFKLPLWQGTYAKEMQAAAATADALRAEQRGVADRAAADVARLASRVRDAARRVRTTEGTLLPQAEAAYTSLLGAYTSGDGSVAQVLLAQEALLELRVQLESARAAHARAWAALEERCGRGIARQPLPPVPAESP